MRRSILSNAARPLRSATSALAHQQPRRMFASPAAHPAGEQPEQVHPIGAFYESILNSQLYADKKPEVPPKSAAPSAQPDTPATPDAPKPAPAATPKPASNSRAATEEAAPAAQAAPTKPRRNGRKPKDADSKAKSVASTATAPFAAAAATAPEPPSSSTQSPPSLSPSPPSPPSSSSSTPPPPPPPPQPKKQDQGSNDVMTDAQARARIVFGSSLAGPAERAERLEAIRTKTRLVAGVLVPPKPEEPDNCCMSGCVNCVWDLYRDDMEAWSEASGEADRRLRAQEAGADIEVTSDSMTATADSKSVKLGVHEVDEGGAVSMDDDGGGSAANWTAGEQRKVAAKDGFWDEELYRNVPVGIREFMKQEKRLKERHLREGTMGG